MKKTFAQIMQEAGDTARKKLTNKVPEWKNAGALIIPKSLNVEQCSSSATAIFKAGAAIEACGASGFAADLTGGLGVDSWAFSKRFGQVLHNEMDAGLSKAVEENFKILGTDNCIFRSMEVKPGCIGTILDGFRPDIIYLDPARRSTDGKKVFLLKDCSPDITELKDELFSFCQDILVKISPMADMTLVSRELGEELKHVYVVGTRGECKELLLHLHKGWNGGYEITCADSGCRMDFPSRSGDTPVHFLAGPEAMGGRFLFEPGAALMKSGCMDIVACRNKLKKAGRSTQLWFCESIPEELVPFGKFFNIKDVLPFSASEIKALASRKLQADVTVKALPLSSEELKKKLRTSTGGTEHIFACAMDFSMEKPGRYMILCSKVS